MDTRYLWVSDIVNDKLYRIDLSPTGIADDVSTGLNTRELTVNTNPFNSSVVITATGFNSRAVIEIYSINGTTVRSTSIADTFTWTGTDDRGTEMPCGTYIVRVSDTETSSYLKLIKL